MHVIFQAYLVGGGKFFGSIFWGLPVYLLNPLINGYGEIENTKRQQCVTYYFSAAFLRSHKTLHFVIPFIEFGGYEDAGGDNPNNCDKPVCKMLKNSAESVHEFGV
jgi:hypothetical protein